MVILHGKHKWLIGKVVKIVNNAKPIKVMVWPEQLTNKKLSVSRIIVAADRLRKLELHSR